MSILLSLVLVLGLFPGMSMTAFAAPEESLLVTINSQGNDSFESGSQTFNNIATVTFSGTVYNDNDEDGWYWYDPRSGTSVTMSVTPAEGYTITKVKFYCWRGSAFDETAPFEARLDGSGPETYVNGSSIGPIGVNKIEVYGYATPSHTHSFTYSANGATITATCTQGCPDGYDTNGITLTINAPANLVCDGSAKEATISGQIPGGSGLPDPSGITYTPGGSTAPTEPGDYTASFSWGGQTVSVSFTLTAPTVAVTGVTLNPGSATVAVGGTTKLTATIAPENATNQKVIWRVSGNDGAVALYSDQACSKPVTKDTLTDVLTVYVKGVSPSTVKIDVDSADQPGLHASCYLTVNTSTYAVTLSGGGNTTYSGGDMSQSVTPGQAMSTVTFTPNSGYHFETYAGASQNGVTAVLSNGVITVSGTPTGNVAITIPAAAAIPTYTVSFAPNGGGGEMAPVQVQAGSTYYLPACGFNAPGGQRFKSWLLGSTEFAPGAPIIVDCPATFVALWEDIPVTLYTVTAHPGENGAAGVSQNAAAPGTLITVDAIPFGGYDVASIAWSVDGGQTRIDITDTASFVMPAANVDVFVVFQPVGGGGGGSWDGFGGGYYVPQQAYRLILAPTENGSALLVVSNGQTSKEMYVYPTTEVRVTTTPAPGYVVDKIVWSLIDGSASYDITQAGAFIMPAMDVVVHVTFKPLGA